MVLNLFKKDKIYLPGEQIDKYTIVKIIGEGRYGICYLVSNNNKNYILKQLKKEMLKKIGKKVCFEEEILSSVNHNCIPRFIEKIEKDKFSGYILEFKEGKTFEEIIFKDDYIFRRKEIYKICFQLISILKYLHSMGIVHRDIRVPNTLYNNGKVYLLDFGLARWINDERYTIDEDFSYLGDFLLHLYYTSFEIVNKKSKPWYDELNLYKEELMFLKRLMGIEKKYKSLDELEHDFLCFKHYAI
ncbi:protein kinase family protein [Clostridium drakei]|uniref:Protein kinase n=1 Tax=Clostridium drakei TaxID=332101 RepID=A0A2U8DR85_9CLOT|nr:protein kinase family protein [Clostridium drakei]AWI05150.1 protein kinase [Clostridium drakei]